MPQKAVLKFNLQGDKDKKKALRVVSCFVGCPGFRQKAGLDLHCYMDKKKALKVISGFFEIDSVAINMKDRKLTVTGEFDPIHLVEKLRKERFTIVIESVCLAKEENSGGGQVVPYPFPIPHQYRANMYQNYPPRPAPRIDYYDRSHSFEEDPDGCVIFCVPDFQF